MNRSTANDITNDLRDMIEPDGYNAGEVIADLAYEYGVPESEIRAIWDEMRRLR